MHLHNRRIKATFWNDPDLLQLPRDMRWFYEGLAQLADDSGCLEDSPFAFKLHLFPSPLDSDITVEVLTEWRDKLIQANKLIPYEVNGKKCLFIFNFHKHQSLKNPEQPEVPLPEWITWKSYKSNPSAGKYVVNYEVLSNFLDTSYEVLTPFFQIEVEEELEEEGERERERNNGGGTNIERVGKKEEAATAADDNPMKTISNSLNKAGIIMPSQFELEKLLSWHDDGMELDTIIYAIEKAALANERKVSYVNGILKSWYRQGIKTLAQAEAADIEFERKKAGSSGQAVTASMPRGPTEEEVRSTVTYIEFSLKEFRAENPDHTDQDLRAFLNSSRFDYDQPELKVKAFEKLNLTQYLERGP